MKRLTFRIFVSLIAIFLFQTNAFSQQKELKGRVVDADTGEPLPYVTIYLGPGRGTLTNEDEDDFCQPEGAHGAGHPLGTCRQENHQ